LADRLRRDRIDSLLVDGDGTVGQLLQFYGERDEAGRLQEQTPDRGVMPFLMTGGVKDRDALINMLEYEKTVVLCDLPAGSITFIRQLEQDVGLFELVAQHGYRLTLVNVISPYRAATRTVSQMIELGGDRADYVVVENAWFGDQEDYILWYGGDGVPVSKGKVLLEQQQGLALRMPKLEGRTCALIDAYNLKYSTAKEDKRLTIADRSRVHRWLRAMDSELDKASEVLGIAKDHHPCTRQESQMSAAG
jgi:hypothetical protein